MLRSSCLLILAFITIACESTIKRHQPSDCEKFKRGAFFYFYGDGLNRNTALIERNDSTQTETNQMNGEITHYKIKWLGSCSYELLFQNCTNYLPDSIISLRKAIPLKTSIIQVSENYYIFEAKKNNHDFIYRDTIWIKK